MAYPVRAEEQKGPKQVVEHVVAKLKQTGSPEAVLDYVDWQHSFTVMPVDQRASLGIANQEDLKAYYEGIFSAPGKALREGASRRIGKLSNEQEKQFEAKLQQIEALIQQKFQELRKKIKETDYKIGAERLQGDQAKVELSTTYQGKLTKSEVELVKTPLGWRFPSPQLLKPFAENEPQVTPIVPPGGFSTPDR